MGHTHIWLPGPQRGTHPLPRGDTVHEAMGYYGAANMDPPGGRSLPRGMAAIAPSLSAARGDPMAIIARPDVHGPGPPGGAGACAMQFPNWKLWNASVPVWRKVKFTGLPIVRPRERHIRSDWRQGGDTPFFPLLLEDIQEM